MTINNSFVEEKAYTAKQKTSLFKKFEKVVKMRDSQLIDKSLYHFLYQYCGYKAHYNWYGFKDHYDGKCQMVMFLEELLYHHFEWGAGNYKDIGNAMKLLAREELPKVKMEVVEERNTKEKSMLLALAQKHGYTVAASTDTSDEKETMTTVAAPSVVLANLETIRTSRTKKQRDCEGQLFLIL
jgi:hypothetical protein